MTMRNPNNPVINPVCLVDYQDKKSIITQISVYYRQLNDVPRVGYNNCYSK